MLFRKALPSDPAPLFLVALLKTRLLAADDDDTFLTASLEIFVNSTLRFGIVEAIEAMISSCFGDSPSDQSQPESKQMA